MTAASMSLLELQRTMASAVMQPLTAGEDMRPRTADGRLTRELAESFIAPNTNLSAFERLEIYNRQYWYRVLSALAEDYPGLRSIVGSRRFHALSIAYLAENPNRSFTLRNLGARLPQWLAANPKYAGRRHALAVDVARIEWAFVETFDAADDTALTPDQIATLDAGSRLGLQPHLQLVALSYPADDLVLGLHKADKKQTSEAGVAADEEEELPIELGRLRRRPIWLAAHRVDFAVYYLRITREEFATLSALRQGIGLGDALATGFVGSRLPAKRQAALVQQWFSTWGELGWICAPPLDSLLKI